MSFGKMNVFIDIITREVTKDNEGFGEKGEKILASVRAYKEGQHGNRKWANRAAFSEADALFRFRYIPGLKVKTKMFIICDDGRYEIISVEDIKNRKMYVEVLVKKVVAAGG